MYDMKNLSRVKQLEVHAPEAARAFWVFDKAAWAEGAIPKKDKERIAAAVALTIQCLDRIDLHVERARKQGASEPEITENMLAAAAWRAGGAITHGTHVMMGI